MYNQPMSVFMRAIAVALLAVGTLSAAVAPDLAREVSRITRSTQWRAQSETPIRFRTHHPQGLVKIGERLFLSSVEVRVPTRRFPSPVDGLDRDAGEGVGHLFQFDINGNLIADLKLGEGAIYHPGGLDYDGRHLWVAVAEYRPNSRSIVYRVDPNTMTATEVFRFADHLGAIVHDTEDNALHGVSWGSRTFYRWPLSRDGRVKDVRPAAAQRAANPSHYVDYQDCNYAGQRRMQCTGVTEFRVTPGAEPFRLGGIELVSLRDRRPLHQVPLSLWIRGLDMTHNPVWLEATDTGLRGYFIPEDDESTLYVYTADTAANIDARPR
jgi:hypothetical protein